ncbi:MAG TPA: hypothetical protein VHQ65_03545 [Thermoanaerobaculia bacterium]|nr:hypothetical protein [Thermoanaerobaculia bacterium]
MRTRHAASLALLPLLVAGTACFGPAEPPETVVVGNVVDVEPQTRRDRDGDGGEAADPATESLEEPMQSTTVGTAALAVAPDVEERLARFAPTPIEADLSALSAEDRRVLALVVEASRRLDPVFLRQVWAGNPALAERIENWRGGERGAAREYFELMFGPWDRLEEMEPFLGGVPHPPGAGYYPEDLDRAELEAWLAAHPDDREAFTSTTTVIRRDGDRLVAVPYSVAYAEHLEPAARLLRQAADETSNESLARFLRLRADAFLSDDYYESDLAWMDLDAPVEVTIGPYETYEDALFGYKAAFESFVTVALPAESAALARYKAELPWLERNLPIPDEDKNLDRGAESPIRVVDEVFTAGDARAGVQTLAFNLPNDERVREAKGSKKVLLRNVMRAKYDTVLEPIARRVLHPDELPHLAFDAYFNFVLHHELSHGLGPGRITVDGRETEVRLELKELYSTLEEAKADVMGVYNILALIERGVMPAELRRTLEATYLAGLFRSARFGLGEAHGRGVVAQFNYLLDRGALAVDDDGLFRTVPERFPGAIRELLADMLTLQARGDYAGTEAFLDRWGVATPELTAAIARLEDVPVDIRPSYPSAPGAVQEAAAGR